MMSTFNKIANTHPIKQFKNCLVKRTKYKLIRYAKGQNLFGLNDYFWFYFDECKSDSL